MLWLFYSPVFLKIILKACSTPTWSSSVITDPCYHPPPSITKIPELHLQAPPQTQLSLPAASPSPPHHPTCDSTVASQLASLSPPTPTPNQHPSSTTTTTTPHPTPPPPQLDGYVFSLFFIVFIYSSRWHVSWHVKVRGHLLGFNSPLAPSGF